MCPPVEQLRDLLMRIRFKEGRDTVDEVDTDNDGDMDVRQTLG